MRQWRQSRPPALGAPAHAGTAGPRARRPAGHGPCRVARPHRLRPAHASPPDAVTGPGRSVRRVRHSGRAVQQSSPGPGGQIPGYPGDTALSRLIGAPDAHERDLGAANRRASCPRAPFMRHGRRGGRLRGRADRLRQPASSRPSGSTTPPPSARRARRRGQRTPVAPAPIPGPDDTDVPARPRPGNQDVHLPRAGRRHSSQPADRPARSPCLRRRAHSAPGRR